MSSVQARPRTIDTARLHLRPPVSSDLDPYVDIHEDPEVMQYLARVGSLTGRVAGWRVLAVMLGHWELRGYGQWTVVERSTGDIIGRVGLWYPEGWPGVELSWIIHRRCWGQGYATEAARVALDFGFTHLETDEIVSLIHPLNVRSVRVASKLAGVRQGTTPVEGVENDIYAYHRARWTATAAT